MRPGPDDPRRPEATTAPSSRKADQRRLPRPEGVGHAAAVQRRVHRRRGAEHPARTSTSRATYRADPTKALHDYLEASALAFADRGAYVGAPRAMQPGVLNRLLSQGFADERFCALDQTKAATKPVPAGDPDGQLRHRLRRRGRQQPRPPPVTTRACRPRTSPTADRWGNVVTYTLTIEQTGGSALTVPGRGFLLNNELTDFDLAPDLGRRTQRARPRQAAAVVDVADDRQPTTAGRCSPLGSPGGSTIITTVLQVLLNRLDFGMSLPQAVAAPRASQRNTKDVQAEAAFDRAGLAAYGHTFVDPPAPGEIGAVTGIQLGKQRPAGRGGRAGAPWRRRRPGGAAPPTDQSPRRRSAPEALGGEDADRGEGGDQEQLVGTLERGEPVVGVPAVEEAGDHAERTVPPRAARSRSARPADDRSRRRSPGEIWATIIGSGIDSLPFRAHRVEQVRAEVTGHRDHRADHRDRDQRRGRRRARCGSARARPRGALLSRRSSRAPPVLAGFPRREPHPACRRLADG